MGDEEENGERGEDKKEKEGERWREGGQEHSTISLGRSDRRAIILTPHIKGTSHGHELVLLEPVYEVIKIAVKL